MAKKKSGSRKRAKARKAPVVTLRIANEGSMAKKKGGSRKRSGHRKGGSHKKPHRRRRRNPSGFLERAGRLLGLAAVTVGTGVAVTYAASKIMPGSNVAMYGIPIAVFLTGAAISTKFPTFGVGVAAGAAAPFVLPIATKVLTSTTPSTPATTAAGIARAYRSMRAVDMGRGMRAVDMGAVDMGYVAYR